MREEGMAVKPVNRSGLYIMVFLISMNTCTAPSLTDIKRVVETECEVRG